MAQTALGQYYLLAYMWAEMKRKVSYRVDIMLDEHGVKEAQCECGAGQGPKAHCKHVITTLYALTQFAPQTGLLTEVTCTQVCMLHDQHQH